MKKRDKNYIWLTLFTIMLLLGIMRFGNLYGSTTDWLSQHTVYPDYFRKLFYETGNLFPNFAFHIGAGQNIYNFSYYGLLNPIYMLSYLFPFIKMVDYIMFVSILSIICSVLICYKWLKKHFPRKISLIATILFLCSAPLVFHSHRHLMFVNYMPFLLLALLGVEKHFEKRNSNLLIFSIFMMIMTSYYYSVGGMVAISIYAISYYIKENKVTLKSFIQEAFLFSIPVLLGILLSSVLLLPTLFSILQSRSDLNSSISMLEIFIPKINMDALLYSNYSLGLTSVAMFSVLFSLVDKRKDTKFLSICSILLLFVPLFVYLLNGTLYLRSKVLIPFLPIFIYQIAYFFKHLEQHKIYPIPFFSIVFLFFIATLLSGYHNSFFLLDFGITFCSIFLVLILKKKWLFYLPIICISLSVFFSSNLSENYVLKADYNRIFSNEIDHFITKTLENNQSNLYRTVYNVDVSSTMNYVFSKNYYGTTLYSSTYHDGYKNFFDHEFKNPLPLRNILDEVATSNGLFHMYMGSMYYISKEDAPIGYEKIGEQGEISIYKNENVLPIGYVSSNVSSLKEYEETPYPYNLENLFQTVVVDKEVSTSLSHQIKEINLDYRVQENDLEIEPQENGYVVKANHSSKVMVDLDTPIEGKYLIIQFDLKKIPSCSSGDISITINGQKNKLTCKEWMYFNQNTSFEYVISSNDIISTLEIEFSKGTFDIQNIKTYVLDYDVIKNRKNEIDEFIIDQNKTKGDFISGKVEVTKDGYFILNIPYDKVFEVKVNQQKVEIEKVNTTFIGFPLEKGIYQIDITYSSPYQKEGKFISLISIILWILLNVYYFLFRKTNHLVKNK